MTIDIMLPFYGRSDHFVQSVESVLAQSADDWRLVIVDDANPDPAPGRWAQELTDPRIEYYRHEVNRGINATFQECIDRSRADWVTIFGCDDLMRPRYVQRIGELVQGHPAARIVHPGTNIIDAEGAPASSLVDTAKALYRPHGAKPLTLSGSALATSITRGNWMNFPALAWHGPTIREIGFQAGYHVVQDLALALDVCRAGGSLLLDDEVVFDYRRHSGSVSSWRAVDGTRFTEEREFFESLVPDFQSRGWTDAARAARIHLSSRINALTRMPSAIRARDRAGLAVLARHVFRR